MTLYSDPPSLLPFRHDKPTLLVCWWATSFCALMIVLRVSGRFVRTERLFLEDKIAALALVPLALRMACVHFVLLFGTNNADFSLVTLSDVVLHRKAIGSCLALASRFFYISTLWILKYAILEFLRRLTDLTWERAHQTTLIAIRWTLVVTFLAVVVSGLTECRPFDHYWQVLPDPGGQCRQAYAQLITMTTCNIFTDLLLVIFPIPIIVQSQMHFRRKLQLILLFSLSLSVVAVSVYRLPRIIQEHGRQQYRSLLASVELIFATAAANALVLGSFVRDRGVKKQKFRRNSAVDSLDRSGNSRRPTLHRQWGSDEDLVRDVGLGIDPGVRDEQPTSLSPTEPLSPAPIAMQPVDDDKQWHGSHGRPNGLALPHDPLSRAADPLSAPRRLSFDVGGLLEASAGGSSSGGSYRRGSYTSSMDPQAVPPSVLPAGTAGVRRGSTVLLQDLGGLPEPPNSNNKSARAPAMTTTGPKTGTELQPIQPHTIVYHDSQPTAGPELIDAGGLLR